jgi:hypothetical protein
LAENCKNWQKTVKVGRILIEMGRTLGKLAENGATTLSITTFSITVNKM